MSRIAWRDSQKILNIQEGCYSDSGPGLVRLNRVFVTLGSTFQAFVCWLLGTGGGRCNVNALSQREMTEALANARCWSAEVGLAARVMGAMAGWESALMFLLRLGSEFWVG